MSRLMASTLGPWVSVNKKPSKISSDNFYEK